MIKIDITPAMKKAAERGDKLIMAKFRDKSANYTGLAVNKRFYTGILGEMAFAYLLKSNGKQARYTPAWGAGVDDGDVHVWIAGIRYKVDVKTAAEPWHENLYMPTKQFDKYTYDGYIGVRLNGDVAEIHGYCSKKDFKVAANPNVKCATMGVALEDLRPIEKILDRIDAGETIIKWN